MKDPVDIHYSDLHFSTTTDPMPGLFEFYERKAGNDLGHYRERHLAIGDIRIHDVISDFDRSCKLYVDDQNLSQAIHLCMPLQGTVGADFTEVGLSTELGTRNHHYVYIPGTAYELGLSRKARVMHIEIGIDYLMSMLCPSERWAEELKERIAKKETVYSGHELSCASTQQVVESILNCNLVGNLRKIFLEGKLLELIALQLNDYNQGKQSPGCPSVKKHDRQWLEALRDYLINDFQANHSLQSLSLQFGVNEFKMKKQFREYYGQTVFDFIFDRRMEYARKLLRDTGLFVNEVSREVGYKNPNHFSTAFRKKFGVSPASLKA